MVFLYEPLGVIVGVAIEEGTISVGDISIWMWSDDFNKFEGVSLGSGLAHTLYQLL